MIYWICVSVLAVFCRIVFRFEVYGRENLPTDRGFILAPNHVSNFDPILVVIARFWGPKMLVIAKQELFKNPFAAWYFGKMGAVSVNRGKGDLEVLASAVEECRKGRGLLIFPEGTRSKTGDILKPKSGAFVVASDAGVDMVPCRILYDTPDGRMKWFCRVRICFGAPIPAEKLALGEKRSASLLRNCKAMLSGEWQKLYDSYHF